MRWNSAGHQLDRQWHPIEFATDASDDLRISVTEVHSVTCGNGAIHEQLYGGVRGDFGFTSQVFRRNLEWGEFEHEFAFRFERFAARCQD
jgi:hypothetical protein